MSMDNHIHPNGGANPEVGILVQIILVLPFVYALVIYILAVAISNRRQKPWPIYRTVSLAISSFLAIISVAGPLANLAHFDFRAHMISHLFLGMLAPLLMALAMPVSLMFRTVSVPTGRMLSKVLRSWPSRVMTNPIVASVLNIGGLWLLYTTNLYVLMHENLVWYVIVHFHIFVAGYLFTISMIYMDPISHRTPFLYRAFVLVVALAGHGILSKYIYAHPPNGVPLYQAEFGGMIMYYGGDIIDAMIIFILCLHWFRATRPKLRLTTDQPENI